MYLAEYQYPADDGRLGDFRQGLVRLTPPPPADPRAGRWWATFERLVGAYPSVPGARAARRATLDPRRGLRLSLLVSAPATSESVLRRYLGAYARLGTVADGSFALAPSRQWYDEVVDDFPRLRCCETMPFAWGAYWVACDFSIAHELDTLLAEAAACGVTFGYHVTVRPVAPGAVQRRAARLNAARLAESPTVRRSVADMQERLAVGLDGVTAVREEIVGVGTREDARWLADALGRAFRLRFRPFGFDAPLFEVADDAYADALACTTVPATEDDPAVLCSQGIDAAGAVEVLAWRPADALAPLVPTLPPEVDDEAAAPLPVAGTPPRVDWVPLGAGLLGGGAGTAGGAGVVVPPSRPSGPYVFVSYKREDLDTIMPILRLVRQQGIEVWYDRGIPGAAEWNGVIEERLAGSALVLLMLSSRAVDSKWVRREAVYADAVSRPIVPVVLEAVQLRHGLDILLASTQRLEARSAEFSARLLETLRGHLAAAPAA